MHESSAEPPYLKRQSSCPNMRRLIVEGWRFIPHSYAIVNQFQCLEMLKHNSLMLYHRDLPFLNPNWTSVTGLFSEDAELKLRTIPSPPEDLDGDVLFRIGYLMIFERALRRRPLFSGPPNMVSFTIECCGAISLFKKCLRIPMLGSLSLPTGRNTVLSVVGSNLNV